MPNWKMFSADDHVDLPYLPGDLWTGRVPRKFRERVPRLVENAEEWHWEADGKLFGARYRYDNYTSIRFGKSPAPVTQEPGRWRPTTPELRLEDMDRDGVECQVMYGGLISGFQLAEPELNTVSLRAYNEWIAEFCAAAPERLIGLGFLPVHGVEAAVEELHHCARLGLKGVQFQAFDATRRVWDEAWEPLWSAAEDTGLPISFHQGAGFWSTGRTNIPPGRGVDLVRITVVAAQLDEVLASLVLSGVLERHPKFRAVLGESSLGWIPYILQKMDQEYAIRPRMRPTGPGALKMKPSEYYPAADVRDVPGGPGGAPAAGRARRGHRACGPRTTRTAIPCGRCRTRPSSRTWPAWTRRWCGRSPGTTPGSSTWERRDGGATSFPLPRE